jgi:hypothetical protein
MDDVASIEEPDPFDLVIGRIGIDDARVTFTDRMLPIPFTAEISELHGSLSSIESGSTAPTEVALQGRVDEYGELVVSGHVTPLEPQKDTIINAAFSNVEIPKFSPYAVRFAGHEIASGKLDLQLDYEVAESQLLGRHNIVLRDFELGDEVPHPDAADLPLGLAVALLKDPSGKIDIDVPISGDIGDPEFSIAGVIGTALGNLLGGIVTSPFRFLARLVGAGDDDLEALTFRPGSDALSPPQQEVAAKLAEALRLRPQLLLEVAGAFDTDADQAALREQSLDARIEAALSASGDAPTADSRAAAIESLFTTRIGEALPAADPDRYVRADQIRTRLIAAEPVAEEALLALAEARAVNSVAAILGHAPAVQQQVRLVPSAEGRLGDDGRVGIKIELRTR